MLHGDKDPHAPYETGPHAMLFPKDVSSISAYQTDADDLALRKGYPTNMMPTMLNGWYAHLMIPLDGYYDYLDPSALAVEAQAERVKSGSVAASSALVLALVAAAVAATRALRSRQARAEPTSAPEMV